MGLKPLIPRNQAKKNADLKQNKKNNQGKSWAILNTNDKFEILGADLIARGVIDS